jgi:phage head maturation protease
MTIRTITDVDLFDVGPVGFPAYEATTAGLRSTETTEEILAQRDAWRQKRQSEAEAVKVRIRQIEVLQATE